jgi:polysaccharide export outer membrane protein
MGNAVMHTRISRLIALFFFFPVGCAQLGSRKMVIPPRPPIDSTLGPGDVFDVRVFQEPDLSGTYRIDTVGTIDYPLIGRVVVAGKLPSDIADTLRTRLTAFVHSPQVSVLVKEVNSKRFIVYGQVAHPGTFPYTNQMTISQAISVAGGFTAMAQREKVRISRLDKDNEVVIEVNLRAIADGKDPNQFITPGDEIYVPERLF